MKKLLKNIANIQTGVFARPAGTGKLAYLQARHFDESGHLISALHPDLPDDDISEKHLLKEGDVLFAAKGPKNFATVFENHSIPAVASTTFFVLRISVPSVLPHFLSWYLNSPVVQKFLKAQAIGTSIPSISMRVLEHLEIPVPEIEIQHTIVQIVKLRNMEKELIQRIEALREKEIEQLITNAIK